MNSLPRRKFLKLSGAAGVALALPFTQRSPAQSTGRPRRPNILVFLTDDHGQWAQYGYGNSELVTPNLDRLAARGVRMTQCFTPTPVCSPARASFFTGRVPSQHGIHDYMEDGITEQEHPGLTGQTLLPELLQRSGYHTGLVGKWHCGRSQKPQPGFDNWFSYWMNQYPHRGTQHFSDNGQQVTEEGYQSPFFTAQALKFLRNHRSDAATKEKPFFLFVGYVDTHSPHKDAPEDLVAQYKSATFRDIPDEEFAACHGKIRNPVDKKGDAERKKRMEYYGAVSSIDREVGKILAELDTSGEMDNTLIVYTGDHGLNTGHHGIWEKGNGTTPQNFLEESIRVSCSVSWPKGGIREKATCDDLVNHCDLWATLLDVAGAKPDAATARQINSPGISYLPQLRGQKAAPWRTTLIGEYGNARWARTERYKLIKRYPFGGVTLPDELYDLKKDPRETVNQYKDGALQDVIRTLSAEIDQFFAKHTVQGHDGLSIESQPGYGHPTPWAFAAKTFA